VERHVLYASPHGSSPRNPLNTSQGGPQLWSDPFEEQKSKTIKPLYGTTPISKIQCVDLPSYCSFETHEIPIEGSYEVR
jgi:hypothetical protein